MPDISENEWFLIIGSNICKGGSLQPQRPDYNSGVNITIPASISQSQYQYDNLDPNIAVLPTQTATAL